MVSERMRRRAGARIRAGEGVRGGWNVANGAKESKVEIVLYPAREGAQASARAYQRAMKEMGLSAAKLAEGLGKGVRYVQQRAAIAANLIKPAAAALTAGKITASHADELARLAPAYQERVWKALFLRPYGGSFASVTLKELREHLARERRSLSSALWRMDEQLTGPGMASTTCVTCAHLAGGTKPVCENPACYEAKRFKVLSRKAEELRAAGKKVFLLSEEYLDQDEKRLLPKGEELSRYEYEAAKPGDKGALEVLSVDSGKTRWMKKKPGYGSCGGSDARWKAEARRRQEKERKAKEAHERKLAELLPRVKDPLPYKVRLEVAWMTLRRMWSDVSRPVLKRHGWDKFKDDWTGRKLRAEVEKLDAAGLARLEVEICLQWGEPSPMSSGKCKGKAKDLATLIGEAYVHGKA